jgi:hypothetical protein
MSAFPQQPTDVRFAPQQTRQWQLIRRALSGCELSWTGPIERNVLARIRCPLKLEAERIDRWGPQVQERHAAASPIEAISTI